MPPTLAGREREIEQFRKALQQTQVLANPLVTGLRGVGKTVLLDRFKATAISQGWLWAGADASDEACKSRENLVTRLFADLSGVTEGFNTHRESGTGPTTAHALNFAYLVERYNAAPWLTSDRLKAVLDTVHAALPQEVKGIVFAYDEAQELARDAQGGPLPMLLEVFQSLQKRGVPFLLVLCGLPALPQQLVAARPNAERMFDVMTLGYLNEEQTLEAIRGPAKNSPIEFTPSAASHIWRLSGGYPYFIQFICRESFDFFAQQMRSGGELRVPVRSIIMKLDSSFFSGRWGKATDRERDLMSIIAELPSADKEFTIKEIASAPPGDIKPFTAAYIGVLVNKLCESGFIYKNRFGKYSFAFPMMASFIKRQKNPLKPIPD